MYILIIYIFILPHLPSVSCKYILNHHNYHHNFITFSLYIHHYHLVALYISSLLIYKYHHSPVHSLNLSNLVNSCFIIYSKCSQFITLSSYLCVSFSFFEIESLQPYPSSLMCRGLVSLLHISTIFLYGLLYLNSANWGGAALHLSPPLGFLLSFLMVGELQLNQMSFDSLPSLPMNPLMEVTSREFAWMLSEWCSADMFCDQHSVFHTAPHLKVLYSQIKICKQTHRSTHASQMLVGLVSVSNPNFRYLQGSWPLVVRMPCLTGAGWSGLLWVLSLTDGAGVGEVIFDSVFRSICLILPHVRADG